MHNRIRIARGNVSTAPNNIKAEEGVPFYDTTNKRLYIGKDNTTPINQYTKNESPIAFEADNVSKTINGNNITDIFEADGITAKNTTKVQNVDLSDHHPHIGNNYFICTNYILSTNTLNIGPNLGAQTYTHTFTVSKKEPLYREDKFPNCLLMEYCISYNYSTYGQSKYYWVLFNGSAGDLVVENKRVWLAKGVSCALVNGTVDFELSCVNNTDDSTKCDYTLKAKFNNANTDNNKTDFSLSAEFYDSGLYDHY